MNKLIRYTVCLLLTSVASLGATAQKAGDSTASRTIYQPLKSAIDSAPLLRDTNMRKKASEWNPRIATIRSAILPGLGQAYNKKYWKIPIVYGALAVPAAIFNYNLKWYRRTRYAYKVLSTTDTPNYPKVHKQLQVFIARNDALALQSYRDEFRRNVDYSVLAFILVWGLNVADATVDAHLKTFDVSPDLSFHLRAGYSELAGTSGVSLVLAFK